MEKTITRRYELNETDIAEAILEWLKNKGLPAPDILSYVQLRADGDSGAISAVVDWQED